jgi:hypothetical protein
MLIGQHTLTAEARRGSAEANRGSHGWSSMLTPLFAAAITSSVMSVVVIRHGRALPSLHRHTSAILRASSARLRVQEGLARVEPALASTGQPSSINWAPPLCAPDANAHGHPPSRLTCRFRSPTRSGEEPQNILNAQNPEATQRKWRRALRPLR